MRSLVFLGDTAVRIDQIAQISKITIKKGKEQYPGIRYYLIGNSNEFVYKFQEERVRDNNFSIIIEKIYKIEITCAY